MSLDAIPIHVINTLPAGPGLTGNAPPLLREISELLRCLLETGETAAIDLSALPLTPPDLDWLHDKLGEGEIAVTLQASGESTLNETAASTALLLTAFGSNTTFTPYFVDMSFRALFRGTFSNSTLIRCLS